MSLPFILRTLANRPMLTLLRGHTTYSHRGSALFLLTLSTLLPADLNSADTTLSADKLFDPEHVVDVQITLAEKDWDTLRRQTRAFALSLKKTPAESHFEYVKGDV